MFFKITATPQRMIGAKAAAIYAGIPPAALGVAPVAMPGGRRLYDLHDIDAAFFISKDAFAHNAIS